MPELTQDEKELIIVALGNSLADPEQVEAEGDVAKLYDRLQAEWGTSYHSSQEIIHIRVEELRKLYIKGYKPKKLKTS